jgi:hypothetical protein
MAAARTAQNPDQHIVLPVRTQRGTVRGPRLTLTRRDGIQRSSSGLVAARRRCHEGCCVQIGAAGGPDHCRMVRIAVDH